MSDHTAVAKRYAKALFEVANERNESARVESELHIIVDSLGENPDFNLLLHHPNIDQSRKVELLRTLFENKISEALFSTLVLLLKKGRESILTDLSRSYTQIANEALGQASASVYTAFPLTEDEERQIAVSFSKLTGKKIKVESSTDPGLIGGIKVRIGDRLYDGSLSGKLDRLEKNLMQSKAL